MSGRSSYDDPALLACREVLQHFEYHTEDKEAVLAGRRYRGFLYADSSRSLSRWHEAIEMINRPLDDLKEISKVTELESDIETLVTSQEYILGSRILSILRNVPTKGMTAAEALALDLYYNSDSYYPTELEDIASSYVREYL